jgi:hypothetical protein
MIRNIWKLLHGSISQRIGTDAPGVGGAAVRKRFGLRAATYGHRTVELLVF